jgi:hypothetical protein
MPAFARLSRFGQLDPAERLRLLADTFALMQAGSADVTRYLRLVDGWQTRPTAPSGNKSSNRCAFCAG